MERSTLEKKSVADLREIAGQVGLTGYSSMRKGELVDALLGEGDDDDRDDRDDDRDDEEGSDEQGSSEEERSARRRADADALIERRRRRSRGDDAPDDDDEDDDDRARRERRGRDDDRDDDSEVREGVLDLLPEGYGFLRTTGYLAGELDVYVSQSYVRRFGLRRGDLLGGPVRFNKGNDRFPALARLETCEGGTVSNENDPLLKDRPELDDLTAVFPSRRLLAGTDEPAAGLLDVLAPQGLGQRTLVVAPHGAGATALLQATARAVLDAGTAQHVMLVLVDARPEEVTWLSRTTPAEVVACELGHAAEDQVALVELAVERSRRLAERGEDVVLLVDSLTAVGRAYAVAAASRNQAVVADPGALAQAKELFGAGRDLEDAGSITIIGTAVEASGSEVDAALLVELQGAATSFVRLVASPVTDGVPAFDLTVTGTLREDLLVEEANLADMVELRGRMADADDPAALLD